MEEETLYERQRSLGLNIPKAVTVVGVGGTGSWVALLNAMSGVPNLFLYDADRIDLTNLNRLPLPPSDVNELKARAIKSLIISLRPDAYVETFDVATAVTLEEVEHEVIFDCTDRHDTQLFLSKWADERSITYIRVGYDGTHMTVTNSIPSWSTGQGVAGYANTPSWVVPAAMAACLGVVKLMYAPVEVSHDIGEVFQRPPRKPNSSLLPSSPFSYIMRPELLTLDDPLNSFELTEDQEEEEE